MKYQYSLTVESPDFQPDVNVTWPASQTLLMALLKGVTVTRLRIENIEEADIFVPVSVTVSMMKGDGK